MLGWKSSADTGRQNPPSHANVDPPRIAKLNKTPSVQKLTSLQNFKQETRVALLSALLAHDSTVKIKLLEAVARSDVGAQAKNLVTHNGILETYKIKRFMDSVIKALLSQLGIQCRF